jgi:acyl-CoA thioesterase FadM
METKTPTSAAIDIITTYHRPILAGDVLTVTVTLVSKGRSAVHMKGEARDRQNKLIASATTNYIMLDPARSNHPAAQLAK